MEVQETGAETERRPRDQVQRTGSAPAETVAAGQISVTPKSNLLQGAPGGGKRSRAREELTVDAPLLQGSPKVHKHSDVLTHAGLPQRYTSQNFQIIDRKRGGGLFEVKIRN